VQLCVGWDVHCESSQVYLYSAFHNVDCIKAASQYQSKHNNVRFLMEKHPCLVELIKGITDWLISLTLPHILGIVCVLFDL